MRIKVDFTVEVDAEDLPTLREVFQVESNDSAALAVRAEAADYLIDYLNDHDVTVKNPEEIRSQIAHPGAARRRFR